MRKSYIMVGVVGILVIILTNVSWAQQGKGPSPGWGAESGRMDNSQTVETLTGEV